MKTLSFIEQVEEVSAAAWGVYNANPLHKKKMEMNPSEIGKLFKSLQQNNVRYLLIGGFAMAFHGHVRATQDIDLWIRNDTNNMDCLKKALVDVGIEEVKWMRNTTQLVGGVSVFTLLHSNLTIDLMHNIKIFKDADFDECFNRAKLGLYQGIQVPVINENDLLKEKLASSRLKDLADIVFLAKKTNYKGPIIDPERFSDLP